MCFEMILENQLDNKIISLIIQGEKDITYSQIKYWSLHLLNLVVVKIII